MDVKSTTNLAVSSTPAQANKVIPKKEAATGTDLQTKIQTDSYQHTQPEQKVTYDKPGVNGKTIQQLKEESDQAYNHLKQIVTEMLKRQGLKFQEIGNTEAEDLNAVNITIEDLKELTVDETAQKEAQAMIDEGGEYSAEIVSDRIVDFAKAISGGDLSKLDILKSAIEKGFEAAEKEFGGELPDISEETYDLTMAKLNQWASEKSPAGQPEAGNTVTA